MGGEVTMVGRVGKDDFGDRLIHGLVEDQIKTNHVIKDPDAPTGIAMIAVATNGENSIVVASGANLKVSAEDVNKARSLMRETDLLLLQLEVPIETISAAVDLAKAYDVPVVLNPAPAQPLSEALLNKIDVLTPNETELMQLSGEDDLDAGIQKLLSWGVQNLIITMGANGARVVNTDMDEHLPAHEITAVDTTAAGDAFNGALGVALAEGLPLRKAVQYGMAAGALAATKRGAQPSLPDRESVENLISSQNG
jgi:ribokinase